MAPPLHKPADLRTHGGRLKAARVAAGLSIKQMAWRLKVCEGTVKDKERHKRGIDHGQLFSWAQHCGVTLEWLITGEGPGPDLSKVDHVTMEGESYRRPRPTELERCMML